MIRKIMTFFLWLVVFTAFSGVLYAADVSSLAEDSGIYDTDDALTYDASQFLKENGITPDSSEWITELTPKIVIEYMLEKLTFNLSLPIKTALSVIAVIIAASISGAAADTVSKSRTENIYKIITVLAAVMVTVPSVEECIRSACDTLSDGSDFMLCYVPAFAGIAASSGTVTSAVSYNAIVLILAEASAVFAGNILMPISAVCMAMNIVGAVNPDFGLSALTELIKKWTAILIGFVMTVFTGLLSIQSVVGVSADTIGIKAAKFVVSNFVPVVGNAVADAYTTMRSGLGLLRGAAGAFGIAAIAVIVLPPIIKTACMYIVMTVGQAVSEMFGADRLSVFFKGTGSVLSLILAILSCFAVMFIVSTIILMAAGLNT